MPKKALLVRYEEKIRHLRAENRTLKAALRTFIDNPRITSAAELEDEDSMEDEDGLLLDDVSAGSSAASEGESEFEDPDDTSAIYDEEDDVYRCPEDSWEIIEGVCQQCGTLYDILTLDNVADRDEASYSTGYISLLPARSRKPRGTSPVDVVDTSKLRALRMRVASREMIQRFQLRFTDDDGIIAIANNSLRAEFAGPAMRDTDTWEIYIGREIQLQPGDRDGESFMRELLEEILLFPLKPCTTKPIWETVRESSHVWVTRPTEAWERYTANLRDANQNADWPLENIKNPEDDDQPNALDEYDRRLGLTLEEREQLHFERAVIEEEEYEPTEASSDDAGDTDEFEEKDGGEDGRENSWPVPLLYGPFIEAGVDDATFDSDEEWDGAEDVGDAARDEVTSTRDGKRKAEDDVIDISSDERSASKRARLSAEEDGWSSADSDFDDEIDINELL